MTEVQYVSGNMDLPDVDPSDNTTWINFIKTQNGWKRPNDVLQLTPGSNNPRDTFYPILNKAEDSWGRFKFSHGVNSASGVP